MAFADRLDCRRLNRPSVPTDGDAPMLVAIDGIDDVDRFPDTEKLNFLVRAWKAAYQTPLLAA